MTSFIDDPSAQTIHKKAFDAAAVQQVVVQIMFSHSRLYFVVRLGFFISSLGHVFLILKTSALLPSITLFLLSLWIFHDSLHYFTTRNIIRLQVVSQSLIGSTHAQVVLTLHDNFLSYEPFSL